MVDDNIKVFTYTNKTGKTHNKLVIKKVNSTIIVSRL